MVVLVEEVEIVYLLVVVEEVEIVYFLVVVVVEVEGGLSVLLAAE